MLFLLLFLLLLLVSLLVLPLPLLLLLVVPISLSLPLLLLEVVALFLDVAVGVDVAGGLCANQCWHRLSCRAHAGAFRRRVRQGCSGNRARDLSHPKRGSCH